MLPELRGWEHDALPSDVQFSIHPLGRLERLAVVGEVREGPVGAKLTQPLFAKRIRLFEPGRAAAARQWLRSSWPD
jgi:hypothetical protein